VPGEGNRVITRGVERKLEAKVGLDEQKPDTRQSPLGK